MVAVASLVWLGNCGEPVREFDGFVKGQIEYLIGGGEGKAWELVSRTIDGSAAGPGTCESGSFWLFVPDGRSGPNPLLYAYDPAICDSADFCSAFPDFCRYDSAFCAENPQMCAGVPPNILHIGTWAVKDPPILNTPTDTIYLYLWNETRTTHLQEITASRLGMEYVSVSGSLVVERFIWQESDQ
jgi:hypothetical protein